MPVISIQQLPQSLAAKRRLAAGITRAVVEAYQVDPEKVQIFIHEVDEQSWARGGTLRSDRDSSPATTRPDTTGAPDTPGGPDTP